MKMFGYFKEKIINGAGFFSKSPKKEKNTKSEDLEELKNAKFLENPETAGHFFLAKTPQISHKNESFNQKQHKDPQSFFKIDKMILHPKKNSDIFISDSRLKPRNSQFFENHKHLLGGNIKAFKIQEELLGKQIEGKSRFFKDKDERMLEAERVNRKFFNQKVQDLKSKRYRFKKKNQKKHACVDHKKGLASPAKMKAGNHKDQTKDLKPNYNAYQSGNSTNQHTNHNSQTNNKLIHTPEQNQHHANEYIRDDSTKNKNPKPRHQKKVHIMVAQSENKYPGSTTPQRPKEDALGLWRHQFLSKLLSSKTFQNDFDAKQWNLGDFQIGQLIGKGSFGNVYVAREKRSGFIVALKIAHLDLLRKFQAEYQVRRELEIMSRLHHPNVLECYGYFFSQNIFCFILEFANEGELYKILKNRPNSCFSEERSSLYMFQMLKGVQYLQSKNIVHRDIKVYIFIYISSTYMYYCYCYIN